MIDKGQHTMTTVTVSTKYQVVIPEEVRKTMDLRPGTKVQVIAYDNRVEFIPLRTAKEMRGFLKGMDTTITREGDRL
jgi:AbrB family looped-hinge helix DNA binding protein